MEHVIITKDLAKRLKLLISYTCAIGGNSVIEELNEAIKTPISGNIAIIDIDKLEVIGGQVAIKRLLMNDHPSKPLPVVKVKTKPTFAQNTKRFLDELNRTYYVYTVPPDVVYSAEGNVIPVTLEIVDKF